MYVKSNENKKKVHTANKKKYICLDHPESQQNFKIKSDMWSYIQVASTQLYILCNV